MFVVKLPRQFRVYDVNVEDAPPAPGLLLGDAPAEALQIGVREVEPGEQLDVDVPELIPFAVACLERPQLLFEWGGSRGRSVHEPGTVNDGHDYAGQQQD